MKHLTALFLALLLSFITAWGVGAQAANSIWMEINQQTYNPGDDVIVSINANSVTPIQGLSFQIRYDPACLQPGTPAGQLPGLNYLSVPQTEGLVDAIFASTTPLSANGALAQIRFKTLAACQTSLNLEKASLSVLDTSKMAVPLPGISLGTSSAALNANTANQPISTPEINPTSTEQASPTPSANTMPTRAAPSVSVRPLNGLVVPIAMVLGLFFLVGLFIVLVLLYRKNSQPTPNALVRVGGTPALFIIRGPGAGMMLPLTRFPCRIGSNPDNEFSIRHPRISPLHAEILADQYGCILVDMDRRGNTYLNGRAIQGRQIRLTTGDAIRLGGVLLVFGTVRSAGD